MAPEAVATSDPQNQPPEGDGNGLRALRRPLFFSGQLLSDEDLTLLADWSLMRFRRERYLQGWGIVRGLEIGAVPESPNAIRIKAGYAIGPDGNDIVLPETHREPLGEVWDAFVAQAGISADGGDVQASFDVSVSYREIATDFKPILGKNDCAVDDICEPSRKRESYAIRIVPTPSPDEREDPASSWLSGYDACLDVIRKFPRNLLAGTESGHSIRAWLNDWIDGVAHDPNQPPHPLTVLPRLRALISQIPEEAPLSAYDLLAILFFMVQDYRMAYLSEGPRSEAPPREVPLGRIWVRGAVKNGKWELSLDSVDGAPPNSRPISDETLPAPLGMVNVAPILLQWRDDAARWLSRRGFRLAYLKELDLEGIAANADPLDRLLGILGGSPFQSPFDDQMVLFTDFGFEGARAVSATAVPPAPLKGLELYARASVSQAFPGETVTFRYALRNVGKLPMRVNIVDTFIGVVASDVEIFPKGEFAVSRDYTIPTDLEPREDGTVQLKPDGNLLISDLVFVEELGADGVPVLQPCEARIELDVLQAVGLQVTVRRQNGIAFNSREIGLVYAIENTGSVFLDVEVTDGKAEPEWRDTAALAPGETASIDRQVSVSDKRARHFEAEALAVGTAVDTRRIHAAANYELTLSSTKGLVVAIVILTLALLVSLGLFVPK